MTLRAHIYIVNKLRKSSVALFLVFFVFAGCAGKAKQYKAVADDPAVRVEEIDLGNRGKPNIWRWVKAVPSEQKNEPKKEILIREKLDLNRDGKIDVTKEFQESELTELKMDLDFDGKIDLSEFYQNGVLTRAELSHQFNGKTDTWRYFEKGVLERIERDTNQDGNVDHWMYFDSSGNLLRTGRDMNYDGVVDIWEQ